MRGTLPQPGSGVTVRFQVDQRGPGTRRVEEASRAPGQTRVLHGQWPLPRDGLTHWAVNTAAFWPRKPGRKPQPGPHRLLCTVRGQVRWALGTQGL